MVVSVVAGLLVLLFAAISRRASWLNELLRKLREPALEEQFCLSALSAGKGWQKDIGASQALDKSSIAIEQSSWPDQTSDLDSGR